MLLRRRLADARRRPESLAGDVAIMSLVMVQISLGLDSIAIAVARYGNGCGALQFMWWVQSIAMLKPAAAAGYAADVPLVFKLHMVNGLTILLVLPFTRLVSVWSVPTRLLLSRDVERGAPSAAA
jgi:nitrate reductase gamma subunit